MNFDTDTIDRLFLELSQFTQATTKREAQMVDRLKIASDLALQLCYTIEGAGASKELTECSVLASALHTCLIQG